MRFSKLIVVLVGIFCFSANANAQLLVEPFSEAGKGRSEISALLSFGEVDYDSGLGSIERSIIGVSGAYGIHTHLDLYGELGFIARSELEKSPDDDVGILLGTGVRGVFYRERQYSIIGRGGIRYIAEEYGLGTEGDILDVELGATGIYDVNENIGLYAGVEVFPVSEGEIDSLAGEFDFGRDDIVGFRLGGNWRLNQFSLNAEFGIISETSFILRLGFPM